MDWVGVKIDAEGLEELEVWAKEKLTPEEQERLAGILDKVIQFTGILGQAAELVDGKLFLTAIQHGVSAIFPNDENLQP